jgi:membrane protein implicated in regulation of membrane protease activity
VFKDFFKDLNWKTAFKRAGTFTLVWVALVYIMSRVFPHSFKIQGSGQVIIFAVYAVLFFFLYAILFAFSDRRRRQRTRDSRDKRRRTGAERNGGEETRESTLKGQFNPNTSRRKARRRR